MQIAGGGGAHQYLSTQKAVSAVQGKPGPHSEFKDSQSYREPALKNRSDEM